MIDSTHSPHPHTTIRFRTSARLHPLTRGAIRENVQLSPRSTHAHSLPVKNTQLTQPLHPNQVKASAWASRLCGNSTK